MSERRVKIARRIVATIIVLWSLDKLLYQGLLQIDPYKFGPKLEVHSLGRLINLHLVPGMYAGKELRGYNQDKGCQKKGQPIDWREIVSIECEIVHESSIVRQYCNLSKKRHIPCAGIVIPQHWFEDPEVQSGIQRVLDNQCKVLAEVRSRTFPDHLSESEKDSIERRYTGMTDDYGCNSWFEIDRGRVQRVAIITLKNPWHEYDRFQDYQEELEEAYERGVQPIMFERAPHTLTRKTNRGRE